MYTFQQTYCNVCNFFTPTLVITDNIGGYSLTSSKHNCSTAFSCPNIQTVLVSQFSLSWPILTDPTVKVSELSNLIYQTSSTNILLFPSNLGWRRVFPSPFWCKAVQSVSAESTPVLQTFKVGWWVKRFEAFSKLWSSSPNIPGSFQLFFKCGLLWHREYAWL